MSKSNYQRRHYQEVAAILADNRPSSQASLGYTQWMNLRGDFILLFTKDNKNFDQFRFVAATEV